MRFLSTLVATRRLVACAVLLALAACDRTTTQNAVPRAASAVPTASAVAPSPVQNAVHVPPVVSAPSAIASAPLIVPAAQIYQPSGLAPGERRPLLIFLHGLGASGKTAFEVLHLEAFGARERVFVVAPDGSVDRQKRQFWNAGSACCNFDRREIDDVARLSQLIDTWRAGPDVDSSRIYVMG